MQPVITLTDQEKQVPTVSFPKYAKFPFPIFNPVQSRVFEIFEEDANCIIAAATSSGKTVAAEMFVANEVRVRGGKAMYLAPLKALAKEKIDDWTSDKHHFSDLNLSICSGDYQLTVSRKKELEEADIVLMTSEMLNSRVRNYEAEHNEWLKSVGTVIVDESHLLTVPGRGDKLEVGLMKFCQINPNARIVFLSATMPNVQEVAEWVSEKLNQKQTYLINSIYRPCPLGIHFEKYIDQRFYDNTEAEKVDLALSIVQDYADDKFLIFAHTKRTGTMMLNALKGVGIKAEFHNADLEKEKRHEVERKFKEDKSQRVIIATSTLAWGCYSFGSKLLCEQAKLKDVAEIEVGDSILSPVGNTFLPKKVVKTRVFEKKTARRVVLESGEDMVVSNDHVFLAAIRKDFPKWVGVKNIEKGDFIATPSNLGIWHDEVVFDRFWYLMGFAFGDECLCESGTHADGSIKAVLDLCFGESVRHLEVVRNLMREEFQIDLKNRVDIFGVIHLHTKQKSIVDQFLSHLPLGRKNGQHRVPDGLYGCSNRVSSFLRGWYDADGGMEDHANNNLSVGLSCISKSAIEDARSLLLGFGIRCSMGKKKMQDSVINGRLQKAKRKFSYRLRIFGWDNLSKFVQFIGFTHPEKNEKLSNYLQSISNKKDCKDLVPARKLIEEHLCANSMSKNLFREITGTDFWNSTNIQDCKRSTLQKLIAATNVHSNLNDLLEQPVYWSRVKSVSKCHGGQFKEIEVEDPHAYVGENAISHNCNFPARRVIIMGIHRGLDVVGSYDIIQMAGRAGRVGLDPRGDVHLLLPHKNFDSLIKHYSKAENINSRLLDYVGNATSKHYKTLAFHLVSEIHHGYVTTKADIHKWYGKSLASFQANALPSEIVDSTLDSLLKCGAIKEENGVYEVTSVGKVASMFYFSPFDVADLKRNFDRVFEYGGDKNDLYVTMALGNIDTYKFGIASRAEKDAMGTYAAQVNRLVSGVLDPAIKAGYAYFCLLNGHDPGPLVGFVRNLQWDFPRLSAVLGALDSLAGRWGKNTFFNRLQLRMQYGVRDDLVELCMIPAIGKVRAEKLYSAGLTSLEDVAENEGNKVGRALNMKPDKIAEIVREAKKMLLTSST